MNALWFWGETAYTLSCQYKNWMRAPLIQDQLILVIKTYYINKRSIKITHRKIRQSFGAFNRPTEQAIRNLFKKLKTLELWIINHLENIASARESVMNDPLTSLPTFSRHLSNQSMENFGRIFAFICLYDSVNTRT